MGKSQKIIKILTVFSEMFDTSLSEDYMERYIKLLEVYPLEKIERAADHITATKKFHKFPLPAEFLEYLDPPDQVQIKATDAWRTVLDTISIHGYVTTIQFADATITQTILAMASTWVEFCNRTRCNDEEFKWLQKEFEKRYAQYAKMPALRNQMLIGWCDTENGEKNPVPALIGQPARKQIEQVAAQKDRVS